MAGIMDFFRNGNNQQQQQQTQNQQQPQDQNNAGTQGNNAPPNGKMPGTDQTPPNPLDSYAKMFEKSADNEAAAPAFSLDAETLGKVAGGLDFTRSINPELIQKAQSGDSGAMIQLINSVAQESYKAAMSHNSTLTDKFVGLREAHTLKGLDGKIRENLTNQHLAATPNYSHPVVKNQLNQIANQLSKQYPDQPPQKIAEMAQQYLQDLVAAINPDSANKGGAGNGQQNTDKEVDWSSYLTQSIQ